MGIHVDNDVVDEVDAIVLVADIGDEIAVLTELGTEGFIGSGVEDMLKLDYGIANIGAR